MYKKKKNGIEDWTQWSDWGFIVKFPIQILKVLFHAGKHLGVPESAPHAGILLASSAICTIDQPQPETRMFDVVT